MKSLRIELIGLEYLAATAYTNARGRIIKTATYAAAQGELVAKLMPWGMDQPPDCRMLRIFAWEAIPASRRKGKDKLVHGDLHRQTPDASNIQKAVEDCLVRARIIGDDCSVCVTQTNKRWGDENALVIEIEYHDT